MSIESAVERMSRDSREYLKDCIMVYKKTGDKKVLEEIFKILRNHGVSASESEVRNIHL